MGEDVSKSQESYLIVVYILVLRLRREGKRTDVSNVAALAWSTGGTSGHYAIGVHLLCCLGDYLHGCQVFVDVVFMEDVNDAGPVDCSILISLVSVALPASNIQYEKGLGDDYRYSSVGVR